MKLCHLPTSGVVGHWRGMFPTAAMALASGQPGEDARDSRIHLEVQGTY